MAAVGYLMLALAVALLVAAVVWLLLSRRKEETPELAEEPPEPEAAPSLSAGFARAQDATSVARALLDEVVAVLEVEFAAVMLIGHNRKEATGLVARN